MAEAMAAEGARIRRVLGGILDAKFGGAMAQESKTFMGMMGNLADQWARYQRMVMASGLFDFLKGRLGEALSWAAGKLGGRPSEQRGMEAGELLV